MELVLACGCISHSLWNEGRLLALAVTHMSDSGKPKTTKKLKSSIFSHRQDRNRAHDE